MSGPKGRDSFKGSAKRIAETFSPFFKLHGQSTVPKYTERLTWTKKNKPNERVLKKCKAMLQAYRGMQKNFSVSEGLMIKGIALITEGNWEEWGLEAACHQLFNKVTANRLRAMGFHLKRACERTNVPVWAKEVLDSEIFPADVLEKDDEKDDEDEDEEADKGSASASAGDELEDGESEEASNCDGAGEVVAKKPAAQSSSAAKKGSKTATDTSKQASKAAPKTKLKPKTPAATAVAPRTPTAAAAPVGGVDSQQREGADPRRFESPAPVPVKQEQAADLEVRTYFSGWDEAQEQAWRAPATHPAQKEYTADIICLAKSGDDDFIHAVFADKSEAIITDVTCLQYRQMIEVRWQKTKGTLWKGEFGMPSC